MNHMKILITFLGRTKGCISVLVTSVIGRKRLNLGDSVGKKLMIGTLVSRRELGAGTRDTKVIILKTRKEAFIDSVPIGR
jgi:hypothetical protein